MQTFLCKYHTRFLLAIFLASVAPVSHAAVCQFIAASGSWTVPGNWSGCGAGNGSPAGTPGTADRAEVTTGNAAILSAGVFNVGDLYLQGGTLQGAGIDGTVAVVVDIKKDPPVPFGDQLVVEDVVGIAEIAAMPRRVGKRSSVMSEIEGIAMAKPMAKTKSGTIAQGIEGGSSSA